MNLVKSKERDQRQYNCKGDLSKLESSSKNDIIKTAR